MKDTKKYNDTLLLPKTNFEMRANLPEKELQTLKFWNEIDLWKKLRHNSKEEKVYSARWSSICQWSYSYGYCSQ